MYIPYSMNVNNFLLLHMWIPKLTYNNNLECYEGNTNNNHIHESWDKFYFDQLLTKNSSHVLYKVY